MAKTLVDIDDDLLEEAAVALRTTTKKDTVNAALRRIVETSKEERLEAYDRLQRAADEGAFDYDKLEELDQ